MKTPLKKDLKQLDQWENHWFPIAVATLRGRFPEVYDWLFLNLSQTEGDGVVISVGTLLARLEQMPTEPSLGARGAEARELLTERGFTPSTLQIPENLLAALGSTAPTVPAAPVDVAAQEAAARRPRRARPSARRRV